jgi:pimeloyl-ACP methyl ester carboxylesterase
MLLDVAACMKHLREKRNIDRVVLVGNSGGGSLAAFYQAEATKPPHERIARSPGGAPTHFEGATMIPADALAYVAAHRGQGRLLLDAIDPAVVDEATPLESDASLDLYDARNGFREPPAWSTYDDAFLTRYSAAQTARVKRLDAIARAHLDAHTEATKESEMASFAGRPFDEREHVLRRRAFEPVMTIHRTMANPRYVSNTIDPSPRDYGSLLSERPDLMNYAAAGFARTCTSRAWLSTWSGLSSNADLVKNVAHVTTPSIFVYAARDREVHPATDVAPTFDASASIDKKLVTIEGARHYFEPDPGVTGEAPHVKQLMDVLVPWVTERFG